jgi:hypothetical protein
MEQNPYQPPDATALPSESEPVHSERGPRPVGIWILSGLHVLVGVLFLAAAIAFQVAAAIGVEDATGPIEADWVLTSLFCALAAYAIISGVGLWRGARWGWWLSAFYWVGMAMNWIGEGSATIWKMRHDDPRLLATLVAIVLVRLVFHFFLVLYHFKHTVRSFFGLHSLRMVRTIAILAGIGIAIGVALGTAMFAYTLATRGAPP